MKPGDLVCVPLPANGLNCQYPTHRVWRVTGVYHGAAGQESVVGLEALDRSPPTAHGGTLDEMHVPLALAEAYVYAQPERKPARIPSQDLEELLRTAVPAPCGPGIVPPPPYEPTPRKRSMPFTWPPAPDQRSGSIQVQTGPNTWIQNAEPESLGGILQSALRNQRDEENLPEAGSGTVPGGLRGDD